MASTKPLGILVSDTVTFCKTHLAVLVTGAVVFGVLTQGVGLALVGSQAQGWKMQLEGFEDRMERTNPRMEELLVKMQEGELTEAEEQEFEVMGRQIAADAMNNMGAIGGAFRAMLPSLGLMFLITLLIGLIAKSFFLVIAVRRMKDPMKAAQATAGSLVPLIGLWLWLFLRSFLWIPFLGVIIAIIVGPRFVLSPLYLLEEHRGVLDSATKSYHHTRGRWGKIVGNCLAVGIVTGIAAILVTKILMGILGSVLGVFVSAIIGEFVTAIMVVFMIQLARTLMEAGPRRA